MNQSVSRLNPLVKAGLANASLSEKWMNYFSGIVFVYYPEEGVMSCLNDKVHEYLGYSFEEFDHVYRLVDLVYPDDREKVEAVLQSFRLLHDGDATRVIARFNHKDGSCRFLRCHCTKSDDVVVIVAENITEQVKFEEDALSARQLFDETEKLLLFGSWSWSLKSDRQEWTEGMYELLEYTEINPEYATTDFLLSHVLPEHVDHLRKVLSEAVQRKIPFETQFVLKTRTGNEKYVFMKGKPLFDKDGNVRKMVGITRDITAKKNFENERDRNIRELNRSNKELEEFAYVASHDLHEPLRKILTFSERLKGRFAESLGDEAKTYLDRIWASADGMRNLIDNLLEFSRTSRSKRSFVSCDLNEIMREVMSDQELRIEETSTDLKTMDLPVVEAVPAELKQLFNNLIGNALKFRRKDIKPVINIVSRKLTHKEKSELLLPFNRVFYEIAVEDNGIGFESIYAEKIFEIFQRLHGKAEYAGSGIGLSICKKIVENHDGIIYATSEPGKGSVFSVILPEKQI